MTNHYLSIVEVFAKQVEEKPDATALVMNDCRISYRTLEQRANFLSQHLRQLGVEKGESIALVMPRSEDLIVAMLAVLKLGAVYIPLDFALPEKRLLHYLNIANCRWIISDKDLPAQVVHERQTINAKNHTLFRSILSEFTEAPIDGDDPCYIMFTSGSTGQPKGVLAPHRGVTRLVIKTNYVDIQPTDVLIQLAPVTFDASTFEIWGALLNGATLVLYPDDMFDPFLFAEQIEKHQITILWLTTALFHLIASHFSDVLKPVKLLMTGGDVLSAIHINNVMDKFPELEVIAAYGPTENTTFTTCHLITQSNRPKESVPIGPAIKHTEIHILDSDLKPVAHGEVGELYTSGAGVALGYLGEIGQTGNGFMLDKGLADGFIYQTGDLVKYDDQGDLIFIGRKDNQVKIRGFRVNLEEPIRVIKTLPGILDATVVLRQLDAGDQALVAYILPETSKELSEDTIRQGLSSVLPAYMVPEFIHITEQLPVNSNGKIDRKKLLESAI